MIQAKGRGLILHLLIIFLGLVLSTIFVEADNNQPMYPSITGKSRGYTTTPQELRVIRDKAEQGIEPYASAVAEVLDIAGHSWSYSLKSKIRCSNADSPAWIDNNYGIEILYAKALAYHLTGQDSYAEEVKNILERIMTEVETISLSSMQCRLNFSWGTPELVASADLIEAYWYEKTCTGPSSTEYDVHDIITGNCKVLFQNWLAKNAYYVTSLSADNAQSNWGAAATNTDAYIADYLWDRPEIVLIHRTTETGETGGIPLTPSEAYQRANQLMLDRIDGYRVEFASSNSCDVLSGPQQSPDFEPVKSQITPEGIIPEDARRDEYCNIPEYNGHYQNYPQVYLGNTIQQCELMLRRGDNRCYQNIDMSDIPNYTYTDSDGDTQSTHLRPGRGSVMRAINAIIIDSHTRWRHDEALEIAYRYYTLTQASPELDAWFDELDRNNLCDQDVCFGTLTHGFAVGETLSLPPAVPPPGFADTNP